MPKSGSTVVHRKPHRNRDDINKYAESDPDKEPKIDRDIDSILAGIGYGIPHEGQRIAVITSLKRKWRDGSLRNRIIDRVLMRRPCSHTIRYTRIGRYVRRAGQTSYGVTHRCELVMLGKEGVYCNEGYAVRIADAETGILEPIMNCWKIVNHRDLKLSERKDILTQLRKHSAEMRKSAAQQKKRRR